MRLVKHSSLHFTPQRCDYLNFEHTTVAKVVNSWILSTQCLLFLVLSEECSMQQQYSNICVWLATHNVANNVSNNSPGHFPGVQFIAPLQLAVHWLPYYIFSQQTGLKSAVHTHPGGSAVPSDINYTNSNSLSYWIISSMCTNDERKKQG